MQGFGKVKTLLVGFLSAFAFYFPPDTYAQPSNEFFNTLNYEAEKKSKEIEKPFSYYQDNNSICCENPDQKESYRNDCGDAALESTVKALKDTKIGSVYEDLDNMIKNYSTLHLSAKNKGTNLSFSDSEEDRNKDEGEQKLYEVYLSANIRDSRPVPAFEFYTRGLELSMDYHFNGDLTSEIQHRYLDEITKGNMKLTSSYGENNFSTSLEYQFVF